MSVDDILQPQDVPAQVWHSALLIWKEPATWYERASHWLRGRLVSDGNARLRALDEQDICWDDSAWREEILAPYLREDLELVCDALADDLRVATIRVYHGCRVEDAGVYHQKGLLRNDPFVLEGIARRIVAEDESLAWMRPHIDKRLADFASRERDTGWIHVCIDDRPQLDDCGQYALYGPEWLQAFFSFSGFEALRKRGVPTILEIDLSLEEVDDHYRRALVDQILNEWVRITVNQPIWTPDLDFTISLERDLPPELVIKHYHPSVLKSPYHQKASFKSPIMTCPSCSART